MHLFYEPEILTNGGYLNSEESKHCIKVLRHAVGDSIRIMDGKGQLITGFITEASKLCRVKISETEETPLPQGGCHIAIAPTKNNDRFEWFLEKSTEIGVQKITPLLCQNSERKIVKPERLEKVITAAMKQSLSTWRPVLEPLVPFSDFVRQNQNGDKFIAHCRDGKESHLFEISRKDRQALILIGPEGDFSVEEIAEAEKNGFVPVSLGEKRLRTETAALAAVHIISLKNSL
ncbi:16S rRNA (uracil(1498)-N(3))-methyltransferase [Alkalitalea saponilacus]|uniref:Ribosomal RNA small subunit methyltransferase E n=1 Tax=Alkalitalea saponilacus TaxID=889453 RepID=A0A1T5HB42_9BACT|nr:16S rRNA (uracil(1498)-N(3))-methyltransferase [Alkalitalea saponilacus]ASB50784.1 16S rRNA (uracil(1498)-N(3))-methyltransferase [Alkalitalea saponilacus]SKC17898.1 16S rRNA (uracil1498-N3)-methyltransferase [Alkalitalea saponilacus]